MLSLAILKWICITLILNAVGVKKLLKTFYRMFGICDGDYSIWTRKKVVYIV